MDLCRKVFDEMPQRDVVSWTVMITGYREAGKFDDALTAFEQMQYAGVRPNEVTMVNALTACSNTGALDVGIRIHDFIKRSGWQLDVILGTSLIHMVSFGQERGEEAVWWFFRMEQEGIKPDEVTLLGVLCACSHCGLIQMAEPIFRSLTDGKYEFEPGIKHYACMVDLFARSGHVEEALKIMKEMPFEPTKPIWSAFLAGCRAHGDLEMSEYAAWKLIELLPENSSHYVLLSNIYAQMGRRIDAEKVLELMKERGLKRDLGCSSVELQPQDHVHELLA
ncbi:tetratricopeptide repeat (TPR)-like superfamily protein [Actinidia rufa]|uniref:Tetratricopeptide repeat (TPR)-like superfamily protein n=1 Tax=Actinidia rufa TaxID=165716 RepID=A0A7J0G1E4_9ERIC|nr:tetratricopeptide repeat (TPR)-like superfamily protein [Actinidia rufa]